MELTNFIGKYKNKIFNIAIIILALIISNNIYKKQTIAVEALKTKNSVEIKKNSALENLGRLEKKINLYKNLLAKKDSGLVINTLSNIAKESGIKIVSIRPQAEQRLQDYIKHPFNLSLVVSSYHALGRFISKVESYTDVYMVESMDIRAQGQPIKELSVNLVVSSIALID